MNTSTTAKVQYTYTSGSANTIRSTGMVYPSGRVLTYSYGSTGGQSDRLSRVESYIDDDGTSHIIDYTFLGAGTFVESDRPQSSLKWSIITNQGGNDPITEFNQLNPPIHERERSPEAMAHEETESNVASLSGGWPRRRFGRLGCGATGCVTG